ncbi:MAG: hypothetical protein WCS42_06425 [Verrucomicrobiota bacterium]
MKISRLPGEAGKLHPDNPERRRDKIQMSKNSHAPPAYHPPAAGKAFPE